MERSRWNRWAMILAGALLLTVPMHADPQDLKALDKTVFEHLKAKASSTVDITLDGSLLKMAAGFLASDGDQDSAHLKKMVGNLKSVTVRGFEFTNKGDYTKADVDLIRAQLRAPEWSRIVEVHNKKDGENAEIYLLAGKDKPQGLFILSAEPLELTVVHIMGVIDMNDLASLENFGSMGHADKADKEDK